MQNNNNSRCFKCRFMVVLFALNDVINEPSRIDNLDGKKWSELIDHEFKYIAHCNIFLQTIKFYMDLHSNLCPIPALSTVYRLVFNSFEFFLCSFPEPQHNNGNMMKKKGLKQCENKWTGKTFKSVKNWNWKSLTNECVDCAWNGFEHFSVWMVLTNIGQANKQSQKSQQNTYVDTNRVRRKMMKIDCRTLSKE